MPEDKKIIGLNRNVFFTGLVSFFMDFSSEMIYPLVPIFLSSVLGVNKSLIGLIEGIAESTASFLKVFSGYLSDRLEKRKIFLIAGYGISTLSRPIIAVSGNWWQVLTFRFIDRFGKGIRGSPRDAIIASSSPPSELGRSFGFHRTMDTFGAVIGPAVAFIILLLSTGNYRLVFWLSMIPGIIAVLVIIFFIKEKKPETGKTTTIPEFSFKKFDWKFKAFILVVTIFALGNSSDVFLILKATDTGIKEYLIPVVYLVFNLIYALTSAPAGIISDKIGKKKIIFLSFILFGFIYLGFALSTKIWYIWVLFILYGIFMGLTEGIQKAFLAGIIPENMRATGYGIYNTFVGIAILPASAVGGYLWDRYNPSATFYYGVITAFISTLLFLIIFGRFKDRSVSSER